MLEEAGRALAALYTLYMTAVGAAGLFGLHVAVLVGILWVRRLPGGLQLTFDLVYGFLNPLVYLTVFAPQSAFRPHHAIDNVLDTFAWALFAGIWGTRLIVSRAAEASPVMRARMARLCVLGLLCLAAFAVMDLTLAWAPVAFGEPRGGRGFFSAVWILAGLAPLYVVPMVLLNRYRIRFARDIEPTGFLLLPQTAARRLAVALAAVVFVTVATSWYHPSDAATRARVAALQPAIRDAAKRNGVEPALLGAIVYVTQHEQIGPFRDHIERLAAGTFLQDATSHLMLAKPFDVSIGVAQIKPLTAITALKICQLGGSPWQLFSKHVRDVPRLGKEWQLDTASVCQPPVDPVPISKPQVIEALARDEGSIAFAALILDLYQRQWREANPAWDIGKRPEILATLYQIGFEKSRPHAAPRSSEFGRRVAEVSRQPWLRAYFDAGTDSVDRELPVAIGNRQFE